MGIGSGDTPNAVVNSLLKYVLAVTGSVSTPGLVRRVNTQIMKIAARKVGGVNRTARTESLHCLVGAATLMNLYVPNCAVFLDGCMRAQTSNIHHRLQRELAVYYSAADFETQDVNIALPLSKVRDTRPRGRIPERWYNAVCCHSQYTTDSIPQNPDATKSIYVRNAEEIEHSHVHRQHVYCFREAYAWLDVALAALRPLGWSPECSKGQQLNTEKALPPENPQGRILFGLIAARDEHHATVRSEFVTWDTQISAHAMVSIVDQVGMTSCIVVNKSKIVHRNLYVYSRLLVCIGNPIFLTESTVVHAIRTMHDWIIDNPACTSETNADIIDR